MGPYTHPESWLHSGGRVVSPNLLQGDGVEVPIRELLSVLLCGGL